MTKELIPYIDNHYQVNLTNRALIGHSLGGTFTTYCLFEYNPSGSNLFSRFLSLSGNYYTDTFDALSAESVMFERITNSTSSNFDISVYLAVGENDDFAANNIALISA